MPAEVAISLDTPIIFLLVLARIGGAFVLVPMPGMNAGPEPARAALSIGFTLALYPLWPAALPGALSIGSLSIWLLGEAAFGLTVGLAVALLIECMLIAAQTLGVQAGYSYAATIDPATAADSNVLLVFSQLCAGLLFFTLGVDREVLRVFARSLTAIPPGAFALQFSTAESVIQLGSHAFSTGVRLALPVVVMLMLIDVALALMGRIHAQLQLITLGFPVKMLTALIMLVALATYYLPVFQGAAARTVSGLMRAF